MAFGFGQPSRQPGGAGSTVASTIASQLRAPPPPTQRPNTRSGRVGYQAGVAPFARRQQRPASPAPQQFLARGGRQTRSNRAGLEGSTESGSERSLDALLTGNTSQPGPSQGYQGPEQTHYNSRPRGGRDKQPEATPPERGRGRGTGRWNQNDGVAPVKAPPNHEDGGIARAFAIHDEHTAPFEVSYRGGEVRGRRGQIGQPATAQNFPQQRGRGLRGNRGSPRHIGEGARRGVSPGRGLAETTPTPNPSRSLTGRGALEAYQQFEASWPPQTGRGSSSQPGRYNLQPLQGRWIGYREEGARSDTYSARGPAGHSGSYQEEKSPLKGADITFNEVLDLLLFVLNKPGPRLSNEQLYVIYANVQLQNIQNTSHPQELLDPANTLGRLRNPLYEAILAEKAKLEQINQIGAQSSVDEELTAAPRDLEPVETTLRDARIPLEERYPSLKWTDKELIEASPPTVTMDSTGALDKFLSEVRQILREKNGTKLQDYLLIEPPYPDLYNVMIAGIQQKYPKGQEDALEEKCSAGLPEARDGINGGPSWSAFIKFITNYFIFLRDVNVDNLLETYNLLRDLVQKCNTALSSMSLGIIILPTVIAYSKVLARLAIGLEDRPDLIAHLPVQTADDGGERETLPEKAANILRQAFITCLQDRSAGPTGLKNGKPDGKKYGIYLLANLCLKILFKCGKIRNVEQIFTNIYNQSPPLSAYPRPERVTFLFYLGRFNFATNHFFRAQLALQAAYDHCPSQRHKQLRTILVYLTACNIILGRFPSESLYALPEASGLRTIFQPICNAIRKGDLASFRRLTDLKHEHAPWLIHYRILLPIRNRCEVMVWRSLARRTFLIRGDAGDPQSGRPPTLNLDDILILSRFLERRALNPLSQLDKGPGKRHTNWIFNAPSTTPASANYVDPDLEGVDPEDLVDPFREIPPWEDQGEVDLPCLPDIHEIESEMASLITQGLVSGVLSHKHRRLIIKGAKTARDAVRAGFPNPWQVIKGRADTEVPGWKRDEAAAAVGGPGRPSPFAGRVGPGMVINLSGARPVGSA